MGTILVCNEVVLEVTQIGKECHSGCEIFKLMGECIMPREGVFTRVIHGGRIREGDTMEISRIGILGNSEDAEPGGRGILGYGID